MNGEFLELYDKLNTRFIDNEKSFASLKTLMVEKWRSHDEDSKAYKKLSTDARNGIQKEVETVKKLLTEKPCKEHSNEMKWIKASVYLLYTVVAASIGFLATQVFIK